MQARTLHASTHQLQEGRQPGLGRADRQQRECVQDAGHVLCVQAVATPQHCLQCWHVNKACSALLWALPLNTWHSSTTLKCEADAMVQCSVRVPELNIQQTTQCDVELWNGTAAQRKCGKSNVPYIQCPWNPTVGKMAVQKCVKVVPRRTSQPTAKPQPPVAAPPARQHLEPCPAWPGPTACWTVPEDEKR